MITLSLKFIDRIYFSVILDVRDCIKYLTILIFGLQIADWINFRKS